MLFWERGVSGVFANDVRLSVFSKTEKEAADILTAKLSVIDGWGRRLSGEFF